MHDVSDLRGPVPPLSLFRQLMLSRPLSRSKDSMAAINPASRNPALTRSGTVHSMNKQRGVHLQSFCWYSSHLFPRYVAKPTLNSQVRVLSAQRMSESATRNGLHSLFADCRSLGASMIPGRCSHHFKSRLRGLSNCRQSWSCVSPAWLVSAVRSTICGATLDCRQCWSCVSPAWFVPVVRSTRGGSALDSRQS